MSKILDVCSKMHGSVVPYISIGGREELLPAQNNKILRTGNNIMARLLAGDAGYSPCAVIFCGDSNNNSPGAIDYDDSYSKLVDGFSAVASADILTRQVADEGGDISVTFTASTATSAGAPADSLDGKYITRAILCCKSGNVWIPFSAINLSPIVQLPSGAKFGIHWDIQINQ